VSILALMFTYVMIIVSAHKVLTLLISWLSWQLHAEDSSHARGLVGYIYKLCTVNCLSRISNGQIACNSIDYGNS
jgi:hypothetical protein